MKSINILFIWNFTLQMFPIYFCQHISRDRRCAKYPGEDDGRCPSLVPGPDLVCVAAVIRIFSSDYQHQDGTTCLLLLLLLPLIPHGDSSPPLDKQLCAPALLQLFCLLQTGAFIDLINSNRARENKKNSRPVCFCNDDMVV